jgi:hypothetical protein
MLLYPVMDSSLERALNVDHQPMHLLEVKPLRSVQCPHLFADKECKSAAKIIPATAIETWLSTRRRLRHNPATSFSELLLPPRLEA